MASFGVETASSSTARTRRSPSTIRGSPAWPRRPAVGCYRRRRNIHRNASASRVGPREGGSGLPNGSYARSTGRHDLVESSGLCDAFRRKRAERLHAAVPIDRSRFTWDVAIGRAAPDCPALEEPPRTRSPAARLRSRSDLRVRERSRSPAPWTGVRTQPFAGIASEIGLLT